MERRKRYKYKKYGRPLTQFKYNETKREPFIMFGDETGDYEIKDGQIIKLTDLPDEIE